MHIITLMSGTILAQVIMFIFMPILTRLYTPSDFGAYALFFSIVTVIGAASSWKYDQAIMLPESARDAQSLVFLSTMITIAMVLFVVIVLYLSYDLFILYFEVLSDVIWILPVGILLVGLNQIANAFTSRHQFYKKLASTRVVISTVTVSVQSISQYAYKIDGLIFGKLLADAVALFLLVKYHMHRKTVLLRYISYRRIYANARKYNKFPKYEALAGFINGASQMIPVFILTYLYSAEIAGLYALTVRVLQVPVTLIGGATRQVFFQRASKMYAAGEDIFKIYTNTTLTLIKIFIIPLFIFLFFGESLFSFVFGDEWKMSGKFAQILIVWFFFIFINSPSMISYSILGLQKTALVLQSISMTMMVLGMYIGYWNESLYMSIVLFVLVSVIASIINMSIIFTRLRDDRV